MGSILSSMMKILSRMKSQKEEKSRVTEISNNEAWKVRLSKSKQTSPLTVVDFYASWCPPSNYLEPDVAILASKYTDISFIKIDVEKLKSVAEEFKVDAIPTLVVLKHGKEVKRTVGAKTKEITEMIDKEVAAVKEEAEASKPTATN